MSLDTIHAALCLYLISDKSRALAQTFREKYVRMHPRKEKFHGSDVRHYSYHHHHRHHHHHLASEDVISCLSFIVLVMYVRALCAVIFSVSRSRVNSTGHLL